MQECYRKAILFITYNKKCHDKELASMAESLVSITNLQRHFTSSEETVGGPVDVAVITKYEGFVWVKRKQWFNQDLNRQIVMDE